MLMLLLAATVALAQAPKPTPDPNLVRIFVQTDDSGEATELASRQQSVKDLASALASKKKALTVVEDEAMEEMPGYDYNWIVKNARLVVDSRNATAHVKAGRNKIVKA